MTQETVAPIAQARSADGMAEHKRPGPGRRTLIAAAGGAAMLAGAAAYRWRAASAGKGPAGLVIHSPAREMPLLRFTDHQGAPTSLAAFHGRVVVLNVWATWCPPCREEMPTLDRLQEALGGPGFEVVTLSIDKEGLPIVQGFFQEVGVKHLRPYVDTYKEVSVLAATGIPLTLLVDREGREAGRKLGPAAWDDPQMLRLIRRYLPASANRQK